MNVFIKDSFSITGRGILVEIKHNENGLRQGLKLFSKNSNQIWEIKQRIVFSHINNHKMFDCETLAPMLLSFSNIELLNISKLKIQEKEKNNIFQYLIKHEFSENIKPQEGEYLEILSFF